jgi:uncharacterized membrane protein HdeD (DUF308 family)
MKFDWIWMLIGLGNIYIGYKVLTKGGPLVGYEYVSDWAGYLLVAAGIACLIASFKIGKKS